MKLYITLITLTLIWTRVTCLKQKSVFLKNNNNKCERITIPMCKDVQYNSTRMPNFVGHNTQAEAAIRVHEFATLEYLQCSPHLKFFLCSMFAPLCSPSYSENVPPCRSVCLSVKESCLPVYKKFNLSWPHYLECDKLPLSQDVHGPCMENPDHSYGNTPAMDSRTRIPYNPPPPPVKGLGGPYSCLGPRVLVQSRHKDFCAPYCDADFLYKYTDKNMSEIWTMIWAILCLLSSLFTVLTFCLDMSRMKYPERPIICLAFCYLWYCLPFIARSMIDPSILSCETTLSGISHLTMGSLRSPGCVLTFMLQYYFMLASSIWWLILTITWFLSSGRYMVSEALQAYSSYFHAAAWGIPAVGTILVLTLKQVDGDELTGLCFVGSMRPEAYLWFVVIPLSFVLFLGTIFIMMGFVALCKIRNAIKQRYLESTEEQYTAAYQKRCIDLGKFEKLMVRIGVFSGLYTFPAMFVIGGHLYQYLQYNSWVELRERELRTCQSQFNTYVKLSTNLRSKSFSKYYQQMGFPDQLTGCELQKSIPYVEMMLLRIFMSLIVGITSGVWVWSSKTLHIWKNFLLKIFCKKGDFRKVQTQQRTSLPMQSDLSSKGIPETPINPWHQSHFVTPTTYPSSPQQQPLLQLNEIGSIQSSNRSSARHKVYPNFRTDTVNQSDYHRSSSQASYANTTPTVQL